MRVCKSLWTMAQTESDWPYWSCWVKVPAFPVPRGETLREAGLEQSALANAQAALDSLG
jgi:hypothetical protein